MSDPIEIHNVSPEQAQHLRMILGNDPISGFEADEGTVKGKCVEVGYRYDPSSGLLTVTPVELPAHLQGDDGTALRTMILHSLHAAVDLPSKCGIYDYVLITIDNQSGQELLYTTSTLSHGDIIVDANSVPTGQSLLAVTGQSRKGSALGAAGNVVFTFADGITHLYITYTLYSQADCTYNANAADGNAASFTVASTTTTGFMDGYTYMKPITTITVK